MTWNDEIVNEVAPRERGTRGKLTTILWQFAPALAADKPQADAKSFRLSKRKTKGKSLIFCKPLE